MANKPNTTVKVNPEAPVAPAVPTAIPEPSVAVEPNNEEVVEEDEESSIKTFDEIVNALTNNRKNKVYKGLVAKNISYNSDASEYRVCITTRQFIPGYVPKIDPESGETTYVMGKTDKVFTTVYAIAAVLKEMDNMTWLGNHVTNNPETLDIILAGMKFDIVSMPVPMGEEYVNPFSQYAEPVTFEYDALLKHIIKIELSDEAKALCRELALSRLVKK